MYLAYTLLTLVLFVVASPYFLYQAIRYKKYVRTVRQRLGYLPVSFNVDGDESIWIHAVSVGEALAARSLAAELKHMYPHLKLFVSTTTIAGQQIARTNLQHIDDVFYFPFDMTFIVKRTLRIVKPRLFLMMETELWPNLLRLCREQGVKTMLVNGRISARSYPRYRMVRRLFRRVLADVDWFCVQSRESYDRLLDIGADPSRMSITGSMKFDSLVAAAPHVTAGRATPDAGHVGLPAVASAQAGHRTSPFDLAQGAPSASRGADDRVLRFFHVSGNRPIILAGCTMRGEEQAVLDAFGHVRGSASRALLVIAPRHTERFGEVFAMASEAGFKTVRRTELVIDEEPRADVIILDSIGELATLYQIATIAFVGGSLVDTGGHNILEPAVFGKAIVFGPHMHNFAEIADAFLKGRAAVQVKDTNELEMALRQLLTDPDERARLGAAARQIVESNRGAKDKTVDVIRHLLPPETTIPAGMRQFRVVR